MFGRELTSDELITLRRLARWADSSPNGWGDVPAIFVRFYDPSGCCWRDLDDVEESWF